MERRAESKAVKRTSRLVRGVYCIAAYPPITPEQYAISASKKGKALQKCRKEKQKLAEEEKRLIREYQPELSLGGSPQIAETTLPGANGVHQAI